MKKREIHCAEAVLAYLIIQLHLIIFGPGRGETDPMRDFRKNLKKDFNNPKFSGINVLDIKSIPCSSAEKCFEFMVKVVGWPDGSWVMVEIATSDNYLSPFIWKPGLIEINIPRFFDKQLLTWMPVPPFFRARSEGEQSKLLDKLIKSVELSDYL
jgi:hypothetical protein